MSKISGCVVASLLVTNCACAAEALSAESAMPIPQATDQQVRQYRMGIEWGCRDTGSAKGDSRQKIAKVCGCAIDTLNDSVSEAEWKAAAYFAFASDQRVEAQIMGPHYRAINPKCEAARAEDLRKAQAPVAIPSVVGAWEWTRPASNCKEVYAFIDKGTALVLSGEETKIETYSLSETSDSTSRYVLSMTTTRDNGGLDCSDSKKDDTGKSSTSFVFINYAGDLMMMCYSAMGGDCFGPLSKVSQ